MLLRPSTVVAALAFLLASCASPYEKFYRGQEDARKLPNYDSSQTGLNVSYSNDIQRDIHAAMRHGYVPVGESSFHGNMNQAKESGLRAQAQKVGATLVIVASKQTGTETGAVPLVLPNNS